MKSKLAALALTSVLAVVAAAPVAAAPSFAPCTPGAAYNPACDANQDGQITVTDIQLTAGHWNQTGTYLSDNSHNHLGQTWTGSNNPLTMTGAYGAPLFSPLILSNSTGVGMRVTSTNSSGIYIDSTGGHGMVVSSASLNGVFVDLASQDGVFICRTGSTSSCTPSSSNNGVEIGNAQNSGVRVNLAGGDGVFVNSAGNSGLSVGSTGQDGVFVCRTGSAANCTPSNLNNGVEIGNAQHNGYSVTSAGANGLYVGNVANNGVYLGAATNGLYVNSASANGVYVDSTGAAGVHVHNSTGTGVVVDSAGANGLYVGNAINNGVYINSAVNGVYVNSVTGAGVGTGTGLYVASAAVGLDVHGSLGAGRFWGDISVTGNCFGCRAANFGVNTGDRSLQPGDVASIQATTSTDFDTVVTLWEVVPAQPGQAIVGVVAGRAELVTEEEHRPTQTGKRLVSREGVVQPGEYVTIVYSGPMQVKATAPIAAGEKLTIDDNAGVRGLRKTEVNGVPVAEDAPVLGIALDESQDGMVWVLVNPQ